MPVLSLTRTQLQQLLFFLFVALLFAFSFRFMWPGSISPDSLDSLRQWQSGNYNTLHPPIMAWIWAQMHTLTLGNRGSLLLLHLFLFWGCIYMLGLITMRYGSIWPYLGALIWLVPPVLTMTAALWKDTAMACSLMLGCLILLYYQQNQYRLDKKITLLVVTLFFFGMMSRHNAIFCMPPLIFWLVNANAPHKTLGHRLLLAALICVAMMAGKHVFEKSLVTKKEQPAQEIMLFDLIYMSKIQGVPLVPDYVYKDKGMDFETFLRRVKIGIGYYQSSKYGTKDPAKWQQLREAYSFMLHNYTWEYLRYRLDIFIDVLNLRGNYWAYIWDIPKFDQKNTLRLFARDYLDFTASSILFHSYFWLYMVMAFTAAGLCQKLPTDYRNPLLYMNISAILYIPPYYFLLTSSEFRYFYWPVVVALFSLALVLPAWDAARKRQTLAPA